LNPTTCPRCASPLGDRLIGVEVSGVYDGILVWCCPDCGHLWPRHGQDRPGPRASAERFIAEQEHTR
jgi:rubrerythrin